ncbi:hypothetical protein [Natronobacterium gregoryi]|uniref:Uncharacterized protein n=2 Tax=Natronobacterium gregoryi TaxID=44930 RepID=L0AGU0_NATGS|nr:hypothetical protein [Natronobacterium gregoryi]AFZ73036.1 hypothetical protein Natgr_1851 [Natronobacterium gregoryi SP2]ELY70701.1 hypothetical protein C490_06184 [Natronobacterium gregoryi SP2]PLK20437.1 hypothetical protein CYV19_09930 [Natronobacterium gregoryi SP2]SFI63044.1 hypothetical protein SAMN05443661_102230 [Natronobacterium gregoryi]
MTDKYRWASHKPLPRDPPVEHGEVLEPSDAELRAFDDLLDPVDEDDGGEGMDTERRIAAAEALAEANYQTAVSEVEAGEADAYLDELEEIDDRDSVQEAIESRREEIA